MTEATTRSRISAPDPEALAPEGRAVFDAALRTFGAPLGPRIPLLHSPDLAVAWNVSAPPLLSPRDAANLPLRVIDPSRLP